MYDDQCVIIEAAYKLGLAYLSGEDVIENEDLAIIWLEKAARNGHVDAINILEIIKEPEKKKIYPESLIHKTARGEMVRSKSEIIIADALFNLHIEYAYERVLTLKDRTILRPDFSIYCVSGDIILWEHLGMLDSQEYKAKWMKKRRAYANNDYEIGRNLFVTTDDDGGRMDSQKIHQTANEINGLVHKGGL
jgi:TPR repeat protein